VFRLDFKLHQGDEVPQITSSLNRYGEFILQAESRESLDEMLNRYAPEIESFITVKN